MLLTTRKQKTRQQNYKLKTPQLVFQPAPMSYSMQYTALLIPFPPLCFLSSHSSHALPLSNCKENELKFSPLVHWGKEPIHASSQSILSYDVLLMGEMFYQKQNAKIF